MPEGTYQPTVFKNFQGGWVSPLDREPDSLQLNEATDILNVDFSGAGSFETRKGYAVYGNRTDSVGKVPTMYSFPRPIYASQTGTSGKILTRQKDNGVTNVLEYYHVGTGQFETIKVTLTQGTIMGYADYVSSVDTIDKLYICDGTIDLQYWSGGHTQLNGALVGGEATINVDSTTGFPSSGTIVIGTTDVTYSGKTATSFTGCAGTPVAADNLAVTDKPVNFSASSGTKPKGNILLVHNSQLYVVQNQFVQISDTDDFTDWAPGASSKATSKGFKAGKITGLSSRGNRVIVFTSDSIQSIEYQYTNDLTGFQLNIETIEESPGYGAKWFQGLVSADSTLFYFGSDNVIRQVVESPVTALYDTNSISENIRNTLALYDSTHVAAGFAKNKLYFFIQSDTSNIKDTVLVFDLKYSRKNESKEAWTKYSMFMECSVVHDGVLIFGGSAQPNCYRMFQDANGDNYLNDDSAAITWYYKMPVLDFGAPEFKYRMSKFVSRGFITQNGNPTYLVQYDYGTQAEQEMTFTGDDEDWVNVPAGDADTGGGDTGGGDTGSEDDPFNGFYPFTFVEGQGTYDAYNLSVVISGNTKNERYKQTRLVLYIEQQDDALTN